MKPRDGESRLFYLRPSTQFSLSFLPLYCVRQSELDFCHLLSKELRGRLLFTAPGVGEISPILQMRKSEAQKVRGQRLHSELGGGRPWNLAFSNSLPITHVVKRIFCNLEALRASSDSLFSGSEVSGSTPAGSLSLWPVPSAFPHTQTDTGLAAGVSGV